MDWLREYATPLACSFLLHFILLVWLAVDFAGTPELPEVKQPKFIKASVVKLKQEQKKSTKPKPPPKKSPPKVEKPKKPVKKPEVTKPVKPKVDPNKKKKEEELKKQKELEKKRKEEQLAREKAEAAAELERQKRIDQLLNNLDDEPEEYEDAADDEVAIASYTLMIQQAIQSQWSRPPSARNGMQCILSIELVPTGNVVSVSIYESSGNDAFDRSAMNAVKKVERFEELSQMENRLFEKNFRSFKLLFKPEDLRL